jgi:hypothetical protein
MPGEAAAFMVPPLIGCTTQLRGMPHASLSGPAHMQHAAARTAAEAAAHTLTMCMRAVGRLGDVLYLGMLIIMSDT